MRSLAATLVFLIALLGVPSSAHAQATDAPAQAEEAPAEPAEADSTQAPADDSEAPPEEQAPPYPPGLDDPSIPLEELQLRVIPLTAEQLQALADAWLGIVQDRTDAVIDLQVQALDAEGAGGDAPRNDLAEASEARGEAFARYTAVVNSFEAKGGDPAAVESYRAYRNSIVVEEKQRADWRTLMNQTIAWALDPEGGIQFAIQVGIVVGAFLGLLIVSKVVRRIARRLFGRIPNLSRLLQAFLAMVVYWLTIAIGLMIVLSALGVNITPLFALVGGASFIAAFAFQDTLGNLASGLMIMINHPFDEGDYVTVAGVGGTVKSVSVVSTTVITPDNQVIVIPNSKVWGDVITNVTASATRRVDFVFGIGYDDSIEEAQRILEQVVHAHPLILSDPAPVIRVNALGASSVDFICRPWVKSDDYWTVYWDLTRQVKEAFDKAGITIPYPQQEMHVHVREAGAPPALIGASTGAGRAQGAPDYRSGDEGAAEEGGTADR